MKWEGDPLWRRYKYYILLIGVALVIYFNGLFGAFLGDDRGQVQYNYIVQSLSNIPRFFLGSTFVPATGSNLDGYFYKPLLSLSYAFIYAFFGAHPFFFHIFQLSLHIANGILVFILFKKFLKEKLAFYLSLLFLIHPINSEAVVYIADLQEPLFFFFGISALLLSLQKDISMKREVVIGFLLLCSLLSKETGILFFIIIAIYQVVFRRNKLQFLKTILVITLPLLIYAYLRFAVARLFFHHVPRLPIVAMPLIKRVFTMPAIFFYYLKTFLFPSTLAFFQTWVVKDITVGSFFAPLFIDCLFIIALIFFGLWTYRRKSALFLPYLFFTLWFLIGIGFHLQIIPLELTVSDRWFYFPIVGLIGITGIMCESLYPAFSHYRQAGIILGIAILCLLSMRTVVRNTNWYDETALLSHDLAISDSSILENNLGNDFSSENDYQQAIIHYKKSIELEPGFGNLYNLANVYKNTGKLKQAIEYYLKALKTNKTPEDYKDYKAFGYKIYENLTFVYILSHEYETAHQYATHALILYPHDGYLWENLAVSEYMLNKKDSALLDIKKAQTFVNNAETQYVYRQISTNQPIQIGQ